MRASCNSPHQRRAECSLGLLLISALLLLIPSAQSFAPSSSAALHRLADGYSSLSHQLASPRIGSSFAHANTGNDIVRYSNNKPSSSRLRLAQSNDDISTDTASITSPIIINDKTSSAILFLILPLLSLTLPILLNLKLYAALSTAKRIYIYLVAASIVVIGSARGATTDSPNLGERLQSLTAEILPGRDALLGLENEEFSESSKAQDDARFEELRALDVVTPTAQSAALPVLVVVSLLLSVLLLQFQGGGLLDIGGISDLVDSAVGSSQGFGAEIATILGPIVESIRSALPPLVQLSNVAVIGLFVRSEVDRGIKAWFGNDTAEQVENSNYEDGDATSSSSSSQLVLPVSGILVALAYLSPPSIAWPVRNLVCSALGIGVVRAVQVPRLGPVIAALFLLIVYDVYSVGMMLVELGSQSLASTGTEAGTTTAVEVATAVSSSGNNAASSAMGTVALSKVGGLGDSSFWQPGLLEVRLRSRVTDLIGLGDAVFPSLLSTFALRYDLNQDEDSNLPPYFLASIAGYGIGCASCELAPDIGSSGLPALLFIVPAMLTAVLGLSVARGDLGGMLDFNPAGDEAEE